MDVPTAMLTGLAVDGGLYVPEKWPHLSISDLDHQAGFPTVVARVMEPFMAGWLDFGQLQELAGQVYTRFDHPDVAPVAFLSDNLHLMELFWGPTFAFKDFALQMLARLFDLILEQRDSHALILGATSGDTGSAAMEAFRDRERVDVVILFPRGRTTEIQRRQMTTIPATNVHAVAVEGTFDDCQDLVKILAGDPVLRRRFGLSTANSINFGRLLPQIAYFYWAALKVGSPLSFAVPSGNFGNVYSGYGARRMGLPVHRLIVGSNANRVLASFFNQQELTLGEVIPTISPSMDIQIPSNLERLLFDLFQQDGPCLDEAMTRLRREGRLTVPAGEAVAPFVSRWFDDQATREIMAQVFQAGGPILDPHSAIGVGAAQNVEVEGPVVCLGTAHPAKFPQAVMSAVDRLPPTPQRLAGITDLPERVTSLPKDFSQLVELLHQVCRF